MPQKGQDGDRYQSAGASARGSPGGVVRLSRLLRNEHSEASIRPVPFPLRFERKRRTTRGLVGVVVLVLPRSFFSRCLLVTRARKSGSVVPLGFYITLQSPASRAYPSAFPSQSAALSTIRVASHVEIKMASVIGSELRPFTLARLGMERHSLVHDARLRIKIWFLRRLGIVISVFQPPKRQLMRAYRLRREKTSQWPVHPSRC